MEVLRREQRISRWTAAKLRLAALTPPELRAPVHTMMGPVPPGEEIPIQLRDPLVENARRMSKEGNDRVQSAFRRIAWLLGICVLVLPTMKVAFGAEWAFQAWRSALFGLALMLAMRAAAAWDFSPSLEEALLIQSEKTRAMERKLLWRSYSPVSRSFHRTIQFSAVFAVVLFYVAVTQAILNKLTWVQAALGLAMVVPLVLGSIFSRRLKRLAVTDLDYVKGTTAAREVIVYWVVASMLFLQRLLSPGDNSVTAGISGSILSVLCVAALVRMVSSGYKEYREARDSV